MTCYAHERLYNAVKLNLSVNAQQYLAEIM
jgi:hypothetical protein